jgi:hypothetical protein
MTDFKTIQKYRRTIYSQNGEEGVLEYVLSKIPNSKWIVEFGAWDGKYLSNSFYFIEQKGFNAVLIEGDSEKMPDLMKNMSPFGNQVHCVNAFVQSSGESSLDNILKGTNTPKEFDVLSVDVDGLDYYIWQGLLHYQPKVVVIEINIKDKPGKEHIHDRNEKEYVWGKSGSSIDSMTKLAHEKGYVLIANVACNAIYLDRKYLHHFFKKEPETSEAYTYESFDNSELSLKECRLKGNKYFIRKILRSLFSLGR